MGAPVRVATFVETNRAKVRTPPGCNICCKQASRSAPRQGCNICRNQLRPVRSPTSHSEYLHAAPIGFYKCCTPDGVPGVWTFHFKNQHTERGFLKNSDEAIGKQTFRVSHCAACQRCRETKLA